MTLTELDTVRGSLERMREHVVVPEDATIRFAQLSLAIDIIHAILDYISQDLETQGEFTQEPT